MGERWAKAAAYPNAKGRLRATLCEVVAATMARAVEVAPFFVRAMPWRGLKSSDRHGTSRVGTGSITAPGDAAQGIPVMMPNFGFAPGIVDYWMLLIDWRNGTFAILLTLSVLLLGYALATRDKVLVPEVPAPVEGPLGVPTLGAE
jgi:hypothetical protein